MCSLRRRRRRRGTTLSHHAHLQSSEPFCSPDSVRQNGIEYRAQTSISCRFPGNSKKWIGPMEEETLLPYLQLPCTEKAGRHLMTVLQNPVTNMWLHSIWGREPRAGWIVLGDPKCKAYTRTTLWTVSTTQSIRKYRPSAQNFTLFQWGINSHQCSSEAT